MKLAAANAIAALVSDEDLNENNIMPEAFDPRVADVVADAVKKTSVDLWHQKPYYSLDAWCKIHTDESFTRLRLISAVPVPTGMAPSIQEAAFSALQAEAAILLLPGSFL